MRRPAKIASQSRAYKKCNRTPGSRLFSVLLLGLLFLFLLSCRKLPDYGKPQFHSNDIPLPPATVTYRDLTISDFKAESLPENLQDFSEKLHAHTAVSIRLNSPAQYTISTQVIDGEKKYVGRVKQLHFEAVMIPERSWWNPDLAAENHTYVLQHEQIHFAIMHLAAMLLNQRGINEKENFIVFESSPDNVKSILIEKVKAMVVDSKQWALYENTLFDRDTSQHHDATMQDWWYNKIATQLGDLTPKTNK